ncbi:M56 family metallopeptidase [Sphingomonas piscis]|uniref:M56 family metallopeptidase n=1 Tax=Sphingomonas piscis TaxID=2714943 RepID=A0A6G7YPU2_9SPHN|nr:M56 family metallopeptidase [Sphingomonas piscis]QIK78760.1 M56 family metallopeptidase [Sphingomonas piscis]
MNALIAIALKSLIVAGFTLLALRLTRGRSAAERSWVAHVGLLALIVLPFAPLAIPVLPVETAAVGQAAAAPQQSAAAAAHAIAQAKVRQAVEADVAAAVPDATLDTGVTAFDLASYLYWIPTALLLGITLLALARLIALRARAEVLVDSHWLSALARAQKRMGFKHGTALLTSDDLPSPISWGMMRPVILLNSRAVDAADEAEAIIAHELAHVARLDWIKLLLARVATALFWFNPLVWMLAREAHQLREEAADDTVLAADIEDTEYAQLLVGIARHECKGLLIGAHGVAPSKGSLARRVARVLDNKIPRGPVAKSFAAGIFVGALAMATPLAALTLVPAGTSKKVANLPTAEQEGHYYPAGGVPLPTTVSDSVNRAVASAVAAVDPRITEALGLQHEAEQTRAEALAEARAALAEARLHWNGVGPRPGSVGPQGPVGPQVKAGRHDQDDAIEEAIAMKALNVTPEYASSLRNVSPHLGPLTNEDLIEMRAVGVTPAYIKEIAESGYRNLDKESLIELRALNVRGRYIRALAQEGYGNLSSDTLVEMRAVGVTPNLIRRLKREGYPRLTPDQLVGMAAVSGTPTAPDPPEPPDDDENDDDH